MRTELLENANEFFRLELQLTGGETVAAIKRFGIARRKCRFARTVEAEIFFCARVHL